MSQAPQQLTICTASAAAAAVGATSGVSSVVRKTSEMICSMIGHTSPSTCTTVDGNVAHLTYNTCHQKKANKRDEAAADEVNVFNDNNRVDHSAALTNVVQRGNIVIESSVLTKHQNRIQRPYVQRTSSKCRTTKCWNSKSQQNVVSSVTQPHPQHSPTSDQFTPLATTLCSVCVRQCSVIEMTTFHAQTLICFDCQKFYKQSLLKKTHLAYECICLDDGDNDDDQKCIDASNSGDDHSRSGASRSSDRYLRCQRCRFEKYCRQLGFIASSFSNERFLATTTTTTIAPTTSSNFGGLIMIAPSCSATSLTSANRVHRVISGGYSSQACAVLPSRLNTIVAHASSSAAPSLPGTSLIASGSKKATTYRNRNWIMIESSAAALATSQQSSVPNKPHPVARRLPISNSLSCNSANKIRISRSDTLATNSQHIIGNKSLLSTQKLPQQLPTFAIKPNGGAVGPNGATYFVLSSSASSSTSKSTQVNKILPFATTSGQRPKQQNAILINLVPQTGATKPLSSTLVRQGTTFVLKSSPSSGETQLMLQPVSSSSLPSSSSSSVSSINLPRTLVSGSTSQLQRCASVSSPIVFSRHGPTGSVNANQQQYSFDSIFNQSHTQAQSRIQHVGTQQVLESKAKTANLSSSNKKRSLLLLGNGSSPLAISSTRTKRTCKDYFVTAQATQQISPIVMNADPNQGTQVLTPQLCTFPEIIIASCLPTENHDRIVKIYRAYRNLLGSAAFSSTTLILELEQNNWIYSRMSAYQSDVTKFRDEVIALAKMNCATSVSENEAANKQNEESWLQVLILRSCWYSTKRGAICAEPNAANLTAYRNVANRPILWFEPNGDERIDIRATGETEANVKILESMIELARTLDTMRMDEVELALASAWLLFASPFHRSPQSNALKQAIHRLMLDYQSILSKASVSNAFGNDSAMTQSGAPELVNKTKRDGVKRVKVTSKVSSALFGPRSAPSSSGSHGVKSLNANRDRYRVMNVLLCLSEISYVSSCLLFGP